MKTEPISPTRYIALDFDNCICHMNDAFWMVWHLYRKVGTDETLAPYQTPLREKWIQMLDDKLSQRRLTFLNESVLMLLKHIEYGGLETRPKVFVYTNNTNEDIVLFLRDLIQKNMKFPSVPWDASYHPQHPARSIETPVLAPDEPGKSFEGIRACLGDPDDLTPSTLLFLDDLIHPIQNTLEERYIHVNPPYLCKDKLYLYLETFVRAFESLETPIPEDVRFRLLVRDHFDSLSSNLKHFPAPRATYHEWNLLRWDDYLSLFVGFGSDEEEDKSQSPQNSDSLTTYYKCREFLK